MSDRPLALVLAHAEDHGAAAVARAVGGRLLTPAALCRAPRWTHTVSAGGEAGGELVLESGLRLTAADIGCVLNRLHGIAPPAFARADDRERDYAAAELRALVVSWLAGLRRPVFHAAGGIGPVGPRSRRQWLAAALRERIPVAREVAATSSRLLPREPGLRPVTVGRWPDAVAGRPVEIRDPPPAAARSVLVAGDRVHGPVEPALAHACVALARRAGCALLGLAFEAGGSRLVDVDAMPPLLDAESVAAAAALLDRACREAA